MLAWRPWCPHRNKRVSRIFHVAKSLELLKLRKKATRSSAAMWFQLLSLTKRLRACLADLMAEVRKAEHELNTSLSAQDAAISECSLAAYEGFP